MKRIAIISAFLLVFAFIPTILAQEREQEQHQRDTQTQQDTQRQDRTTQETQRQDRTTTQGTTAQDTSTFTGELIELDTEDKQIRLKNSQGDEMEFEYNEQTQISGADQNVSGLFSEQGMRLTVTYREEGGFMGSNIATRIQVEQGQGFQRSPGQDQGSQRYGETRDQSTQGQTTTRTQGQTTTRTQDRTQQEDDTWAQDRDRSTTRTQDQTTTRTQDRTQQEDDTWAQDRDRSTTETQDRSSTQTQDRSTTQRQDQTGQRTQQYGSQQSSFSGELVDVDTTEQKLTVRNDQGEEMKFSYSQQTEVSGADQSIAGLATRSGSKVTIHYSEAGEGQSKEKTAQKIHVEQQRESQQNR